MLGEALATLEGGHGATVTPTGLAAITLVTSLLLDETAVPAAGLGMRTVLLAQEDDADTAWERAASLPEAVSRLLEPESATAGSTP